MKAKRSRTPPKKWRRNMIASLAFLAVLDAIILSSTPDATRIAFASIVTVVVGLTIAKIWRSNTAIEKAAASGGNASPNVKR